MYTCLIFLSLDFFLLLCCSDILEDSVQNSDNMPFSFPWMGLGIFLLGDSYILIGQGNYSQACGRSFYYVNSSHYLPQGRVFWVIAFNINFVLLAGFIIFLSCDHFKPITLSLYFGPFSFCIQCPLLHSYLCLFVLRHLPIFPVLCNLYFTSPIVGLLVENKTVAIISNHFNQCHGNKNILL